MGFLYHATSDTNADSIAQDGVLKTHKPWQGTEQDAWPDGSTETRAYFTRNEASAASFYPDNGAPVLLRIDDSKVPGAREERYTRDVYVTKPVPAAGFEAKNADGTWQKLDAWAQRSGARGVTAGTKKDFDAIEAYVDTGAYFTFSDTTKFSARPTYGYGTTPHGFYGYPLTRALFDAWKWQKSTDVDFATDRDWVLIWRFKTSAKILDFETTKFTSREVNSAIQEAFDAGLEALNDRVLSLDASEAGKEALGALVNEEMTLQEADDILQTSGDEAASRALWMDIVPSRHDEFESLSGWIDFQLRLARYRGGDTAVVFRALWLSVNRDAIAWNTRLRELGFDGVRDPGTSSVHVAEPAQGHALDPTAVEPVTVVRNPTREGTRDDKTQRDDIRKDQWATLEAVRAGKPVNVVEAIESHSYWHYSVADLLRNASDADLARLAAHESANVRRDVERALNDRATEKKLVTYIEKVDAGQIPDLAGLERYEVIRLMHETKNPESAEKLRTFLRAPVQPRTAAADLGPGTELNIKIPVQNLFLLNRWGHPLRPNRIQYQLDHFEEMPPIEVSVGTSFETSQSDFVHVYDPQVEDEDRPDFSSKLDSSHPVYTVSDGHHRTRVLQDRGVEWIDAVVTIPEAPHYLKGPRLAQWNAEIQEAIAKLQAVTGATPDQRTAAADEGARSIVVAIPANRREAIEAEEADVARRLAAGEQGITYYWQMGQLPKEQPARVYFAWDGKVRAYHDVVGMEHNSKGRGGRIILAPEINEVPGAEQQPMPGFRGFRYFTAAIKHSPREPFVYINKFAPKVISDYDGMSARAALSLGRLPDDVVHDSNINTVEYVLVNTTRKMAAFLHSGLEYLAQSASSTNYSHAVRNVVERLDMVLENDGELARIERAVQAASVDRLDSAVADWNSAIVHYTAKGIDVSDLDPVNPADVAAIKAWLEASAALRGQLETMRSKIGELAKVRTDDRRPEHEAVEVLYHASVNAKQIAAEGFTTSIPEAGGIGGSQSTNDYSKGTSFTSDLYVAKEIARSLREVIAIANGEITYDTVLRWCAEAGLDPDAIDKLARDTFIYGNDRPIPKAHQEPGYFPKTKGKPHRDDPKSVFGLYKAYMAMASHSRKRYDPLYFNVSINNFKGKDASDVGIVSAKVDMTNKKVTYLSAMHEWRVPPEAILGVVGFIGERPGRAAAAIQSNEHLAYLLGAKGTVAQIGPERGKTPAEGIAHWVSPQGSHRYVWLVDGKPVSAIQVVAGKDSAHVANAFTAAEHRRRGLSTKLVEQARQDFGALTFSDDLSDDGEALVKSLQADQLPGGAADDKPVSDFDPAAFEEGTKHETEHTNDEALASEIARDHLVEDQQYYEKLKKIEAAGPTLGDPTPVTKGLLPYLKNRKFDSARNWQSIKAALHSDGWANLLQRVGTTPEAFDTAEQDADQEFYDLCTRIDDTITEPEAQKITEFLHRYDPMEAPSWAFFSDPEIVKPGTWLIHFTEDARSIRDSGFTRGVDDVTQLGLTTYLRDDYKSDGGYSFAYVAGSRHSLLGPEKYGREAVMFRAVGVKAYHFGDEEDQVIFWGASVDPSGIVALTYEDGEYCVAAAHRSNSGRECLYRGTLDQAVSWVKSNFNQYRKHITGTRTIEAAEPKKPTIIKPTTKLRTLGVEPRNPEDREHQLDLGRLVETPDGRGKMLDYKKSSDGDVYVEIEYADGSSKWYNEDSLNLTTDERSEELALEQELEQSKAEAARAGFRTDRVYFHATPSEEGPTFDQFDPKLKGARDSGWYGVGYYFTPDIGYSRIYGTPRAFYLKYDNPYKITDENVSGLADRLGVTAKTFGRWLKKNGYDAVERWRGDYLQEVVIFDLTRVRDVNARFKNLKLRKLMASADDVLSTYQDLVGRLRSAGAKRVTTPRGAALRATANGTTTMVPIDAAALIDWQMKKFGLDRDQALVELSSYIQESLQPLVDAFEQSKPERDERQKSEDADAKLDQEGKHVDGKLPKRGPVWMYHATSTALLPSIEAEGLLADPPKRTHAEGLGSTEQSAVYLHATGSGPEFDGYLRRAVAEQGGRPVTLRVLVNAEDLEKDPDDADIACGQRQFIYRGDISPSQIRAVDGQWRTAAANGFKADAGSADIEALTALAKESETFDDFRSKVQQKHLVDLSNPEGHRFGRAFPTWASEDPDVSCADILETGQYLEDIKYSNPTEYYAITRKAPWIWVYRAVPARFARQGIRVGDYVALDPAYARMHGRSVLRGEQKEAWKTIKARVPKSDVIWGQADFTEWAYSPKALRDRVKTLEDFYKEVTGRDTKSAPAADPVDSVPYVPDPVLSVWQQFEEASVGAQATARFYGREETFTKQPDGRWQSDLVEHRPEPVDLESLLRLPGRQLKTAALVDIPPKGVRAYEVVDGHHRATAAARKSLKTLRGYRVDALTSDDVARYGNPHFLPVVTDEESTSWHEKSKTMARKKKNIRAGMGSGGLRRGKTAAWEEVERAIDELSGGDIALRQQYEQSARSMQAEDYEDFEIVQQLRSRRDRDKLERNIENVAGATYVGESGNYWVYRIDTWDAASKLGNRNWCIVRERSWYTKYTEDGVTFYFYVSRFTGAPASYAVAVNESGTQEVYDANDTLLDVFEEETQPVMQQLTPEQRETALKARRLQNEMAKGTLAPDIAYQCVRGEFEGIQPAIFFGALLSHPSAWSLFDALSPENKEQAMMYYGAGLRYYRDKLQAIGAAPFPGSADAVYFPITYLEINNAYVYSGEVEVRGAISFANHPDDRSMFIVALRYNQHHEDLRRYRREDFSRYVGVKTSVEEDEHYLEQIINKANEEVDFGELVSSAWENTDTIYVPVLQVGEVYGFRNRDEGTYLGVDEDGDFVFDLSGGWKWFDPTTLMSKLKYQGDAYVDEWTNTLTDGIEFSDENGKTLSGDFSSLFDVAVHHLSEWAERTPVALDDEESSDREASKTAALVDIPPKMREQARAFVAAAHQTINARAALQATSALEAWYASLPYRITSVQNEIDDLPSNVEKITGGLASLRPEEDNSFQIDIPPMGAATEAMRHEIWCQRTRPTPVYRYSRVLGSADGMPYESAEEVIAAAREDLDRALAWFERMNAAGIDADDNYACSKSIVEYFSAKPEDAKSVGAIYEILPVDLEGWRYNSKDAAAAVAEHAPNGYVLKMSEADEVVGEQSASGYFDAFHPGRPLLFVQVLSASYGHAAQKTLRSALSTLDHELMHFAQILLKWTKGLNTLGGLPSGVAENAYGVGLPHAKRPVEFYPNIVTELGAFEETMRNSASDRDFEARKWVHGPRFFELKRHDEQRWKKFVTEFLRAVKKGPSKTASNASSASVAAATPRMGAGRMKQAAGEVVERKIDELAAGDVAKRQQLETLAAHLYSLDYEDEEVVAELAKRQTPAQRKVRPNVPGADLVGEVNGFDVYHIQTYQASQALGTKNWCIVRDEKHWNDYTSQASFYFYVPPQGAPAWYAVAVFDDTGMTETYNFNDDLCRTFAHGLHTTRAPLPDKAKAYALVNSVMKQLVLTQPVDFVVRQLLEARGPKASHDHKIITEALAHAGYTGATDAYPRIDVDALLATAMSRRDFADIVARINERSRHFFKYQNEFLDAFEDAYPDSYYAIYPFKDKNLKIIDVDTHSIDVIFLNNAIHVDLRETVYLSRVKVSISYAATFDFDDDAGTWELLFRSGNLAVLDDDDSKRSEARKWFSRAGLRERLKARAREAASDWVEQNPRQMPKREDLRYTYLIRVIDANGSIRILNSKAADEVQVIDKAKHLVETEGLDSSIPLSTGDNVQVTRTRADNPHVRPKIIWDARRDYRSAKTGTTRATQVLNSNGLQIMYYDKDKLETRAQAVKQLQAKAGSAKLPARSASARNAAGLIDVNALVEAIAKPLYTSMYETTRALRKDDDVLVNGFDFGNLVIDTRRRFSELTGVSLSQVDWFPIRRLPEGRAVLKTEEAQRRFGSVRIFIDGGSGHSYFQEPQASAGTTAEVHIKIASYLLALIRSPFGSDWEGAISRIISHEIRHAADWAYQNAASEGQFALRNPVDEEYDTMGSAYYNTPTELLSYAGNAAEKLWRLLGPGWKTMSGREITEWLVTARDKPYKAMKPENRKKYLQLVVSGLYKLNQAHNDRVDVDFDEDKVEAHITAGKKTLERLLQKNPGDADVLKALADGDPTPNHDWLEGMYAWWKTSQDVDVVVQTADRLDKFSPQLKKLDKPYSPFTAKSVEEALTVIRQAIAENVEPRLRKKDAKYELVVEEHGLKIYRVDNKEAACVLGADSDWCSAKWTKDWYESRLNMYGGNTVYIAKFDDGRAYMVRVDRADRLRTAYDKQDVDVFGSDDAGYVAIAEALKKAKITSSIRSSDSDALMRVLQGYGAWATGDHLPDAVEAWLNADITARGANAWLAAGIYEADSARMLEDAGVKPHMLSDFDSGDSSIGDIAPDTIIRRLVGLDGYALYDQEGTEPLFAASTQAQTRKSFLLAALDEDDVVESEDPLQLYRARVNDRGEVVSLIGDEYEVLEMTEMVGLLYGDESDTDTFNEVVAVFNTVKEAEAAVSTALEPDKLAAWGWAYATFNVRAFERELIADFSNWKTVQKFSVEESHEGARSSELTTVYYVTRNEPTDVPVALVAGLDLNVLLAKKRTADLSWAQAGGYTVYTAELPLRDAQYALIPANTKKLPDDAKFDHAAPDVYAEGTVTLQHGQVAGWASDVLRAANGLVQEVKIEYPIRLRFNPNAAYAQAKKRRVMWQNEESRLPLTQERAAPLAPEFIKTDYTHSYERDARWTAFFDSAPIGTVVEDAEDFSNRRRWTKKDKRVWMLDDEDTHYNLPRPSGTPVMTFPQERLPMTADRKPVHAYLRNGDEAGRAPGIFLPIPDSLAAQFPATRGDDSSPPHFTIAYVLGRRGDPLGPHNDENPIVRGKPTGAQPDLPCLNEQDRNDMITAVSAATKGFSAFDLTLEKGVEWFENHKGEQIAHKEPEAGSKGAKQLERLALRVRKALADAGFVVSFADKPFLAHATLAYLPTRDYVGVVPEGSFPVDHVELWGWPETWSFNFERTAQRKAAPTKLRRKREYDHICPHCNEVIYEKHIFSTPPDFKTIKHLDCGGVIEFSAVPVTEREASMRAATSISGPLTLYAAVTGAQIVRVVADMDLTALQRAVAALDPTAPWSAVILEEVPTDLARKLLTVGLEDASLDPTRAYADAASYMGAVLAEVKPAAS